MATTVVYSANRVLFASVLLPPAAACISEVEGTVSCTMTGIVPDCLPANDNAADKAAGSIAAVGVLCFGRGGTLGVLSAARLVVLLKALSTKKVINIKAKLRL